jgi:glycosyltransferase involved in cell wall biosynthesis
VLAIGDIANLMFTLSKYTKKSKIHLINFLKDGAGVFTYADNVELFDSYKVSKQIKKINEIKDDFDICITMGTGERIAYLADLNYISYYVGNDIEAPRFVKNSKEPWANDALHKLNFLERVFYKNSFSNAVAHVAGTWVYDYLKKYDKNAIRMDRVPIDSRMFNSKAEPLEKKKSKFTFFSPQRMGRQKGTDLLWNALKLCKSDFKVIQVNWFDEGTDEELETKKQLLDNIPDQVHLIPMIKRNDMAKYYNFVDAILGNMRVGSHALVEFEGVMCNKPVIQYSNPKMKIIIAGKESESPFLPHSNEPNKIAEIIDMVVESKEFRDKLFEEEFKFVREVGDPVKYAEWWDNFFEEQTKKYKSIKRNSSRIKIQLRMLFFLFANRLYFKKIKSRLTNNISRSYNTKNYKTSSR